MNTIKTVMTIDGFQRLQLISLSHALIMADKHKMYCYCPPSTIRSLTKDWLSKVGVEVKGTERWSKLNTLFHASYGLLVKDVDKKETL
jgi:hypothetical protein